MNSLLQSEEFCREQSCYLLIFRTFIFPSWKFVNLDFVYFSTIVEGTIYVYMLSNHSAVKQKKKGF